MLKRTPVFTAFAPQLVGSGVQPDLHNLQTLLWESALNVSFVNGKVRRRKPEELLYSAGASPIRGISQMQDSSGVRWLWAASGGTIKRWYGPAAETIATGLTWEEDDGILYPATFFDFQPFGNWMIYNSGQGQPILYKPGGTHAALGDAPSNVTVLFKRANFILAIGYGDNGTRVGWSDSDNIETWTATASNLAGSLSVSEFNTPIRAAVSLGSEIALYAEDQMAVLSFIGSPFYFGYKFRLDGIGAVNKRAVASDGRNNVGVSRNGCWWTDGTSMRYIDEGIIREYFQNNVNWNQKGKIVCARNDLTGCFDFSFPMGSSLVPSEGWSYDPKSNAWYEIEPFSDKDERRIFSKPILGGLTGDLSLDEGGTDGNALMLETKPLLGQVQSEDGLRDVHNVVKVDEVDMLLKAATGVEWRLGSCKEPDGEYSWTNWRSASAGAITYPVERGLPSAPYHKLAWRSTLDNWDFDLQGFMLFGSIEGTKGAS